jgi:hypothetical protein
MGRSGSLACDADAGRVYVGPLAQVVREQQHVPHLRDAHAHAHTHASLDSHMPALTYLCRHCAHR